MQWKGGGGNTIYHKRGAVWEILLKNDAKKLKFLGLKKFLFKSKSAKIIYTPSIYILYCYSNVYYRRLLKRVEII